MIIIQINLQSMERRILRVIVNVIIVEVKTETEEIINE